MQEENKLSDTNYRGNAETREAIEKAKELDLGPQADKGIGLANALASLNVAESLQMFQMVLENQTNKIIKSNNKHSWTMIGLTLALVFVGGVTAWATVTSSNIYNRLLLLEEISREPVLLVSIDGALDNSGNFSGQVYIENAGPVPVSNIRYGVSDFNSGSWRTPLDFPTSTPVTNSDVFHKGTVHSMIINHHGTLAPGKEFSIPIWIEDLETPNTIPSVWVGVIFTRHPSGPQRCVELNYVPLKEYEESPVYSAECGTWWQASEERQSGK